MFFFLGEKVQEMANQRQDDKEVALKMWCILVDYLSVCSIVLHSQVRYDSWVYPTQARDLFMEFWTSNCSIMFYQISFYDMCSKNWTDATVCILMSISGELCVYHLKYSLKMSWYTHTRVCVCVFECVCVTY